MEPLHFEELEKGEDITIEKLAIMIRKGFRHTDAQFHIMDGRLHDIESRLGSIENLILKDYGQRIEQLEQQVKKLMEALAV
jgi:archaellum component FlaC